MLFLGDDVLGGVKVQWGIKVLHTVLQKQFSDLCESLQVSLYPVTSKYHSKTGQHSPHCSAKVYRSPAMENCELANLRDGKLSKQIKSSLYFFTFFQPTFNLPIPFYSFPVFTQNECEKGSKTTCSICQSNDEAGFVRTRMLTHKLTDRHHKLWIWMDGD